MREGTSSPARGGRKETPAGGSGMAGRPQDGGEPVRLPSDWIGPGTCLGGFRIERLLGDGGMGQVFLARQLSLGRDVALKVLPQRYAADRDTVASFMNELHLLARLEHPNIVTVHEAGEDDGVLFMAMAYIRGDTVEQRLATYGRMPEVEALRLVRAVAEALGYAWASHRLLHLDIKPSNILLDPGGVPKLADFGISQSLRRQAEDEPAADDTDIQGTPNYMSPEQAAGEAVLDPRADIYALGATLYHMVTGARPFGDSDVEETLRRQIAEALPDPRSLAPRLSRPCAALLARMLAKDPAARYPDWETLRLDIDRVLDGRMPRDGGAPIAQTFHPAPEAARRPRTGAVLAGAALLAAAVAAGFVFRNLASPNLRPDEDPVAAPVEPDPEPDPTTREAEAQAAVEAAAEFARENPEDFDGIVARFEAARAVADGTDHAEMAIAELRRARRERLAAARGVLDRLEREVHELLDAGLLAEAIALVEDYDGAHAAISAAGRARLAEGIREEAIRAEEAARVEDARREAEAARLAAEAAEQARRAQVAQAAGTLRRAVAEAVMGEAYDAAAARLEAGIADPELEDVRDDLATLRDEVRAVATYATDGLLQSFRNDRGRAVTIEFAGGAETWTIYGVQEDTIELRRSVGHGFVARRIRAADLTLAERLRRTGTQAAPAPDVLRGLLLCRLGHTEPGLRMLQRAGTPLGELLAETRLQTEREAQEERSAETVDPETEADRMARLREALRAANPELGDGFRMRHRSIEGGLALDLSNNPELQSLTPLAGLPLVSLNLQNCGIEDLEPLRGLRLRELNLAGTRVTDLGPIERHPLGSLNLADAPVANLAPLRGSPIEDLDLSGTQVDSLMFVSGLPLRRLVIRGMHMTSLRPLFGLRLEELHIGEGADIEDLRPLRGMPLQRLSIVADRVVDLGPLAGMPLEELSIERPDPGSRVARDLRPLRGLPLRHLVLVGFQVTDLSPLEGLPLVHLDLSRNRTLTDLEPLRESPLEVVRLAWTGVEDLEPLRGAPVRELDLRGTPVRNLAACADMPLEHLSLRDCPNVRSLGPLLRCTRLQTLVLPPAAVNVERLQGHPSLERIGFTRGRLVPVADFWGQSPDARARP